MKKIAEVYIKKNIKNTNLFFFQVLKRFLTEINSVSDKEYIFKDVSELSSELLCFCLFCCFTSQVNSYGHCGTVSSPNHTFS